MSASRESEVPLREQLRQGARRFVPLYLEVDFRTLGLMRIVLGLFLALHAIRLWCEARLYYSNEGIFTGDWNLFRTSSDFQFSLLFSFSSPAEVHVAFGLMVATFLGLAIGYRSKVFSVASFVWVVSLDSRLLLIENGGYIVANLLAFWLMLLPAGKRFSVDALLRARRGEETPSGTYRSLASFTLLLNFAIIYLFNVVNKSGSTWRAGHSVHHALHLDRLGTPLGALFRDLTPAPALVAIDHTVLVWEASLCCLILWPYGRRFTRPIAMILIVGLHGAFGTMMRLGPFSWAMISWSFVLLAPVQWEILEAFWRRRKEARVTLPDDGAGHALRRWLIALDPVQALSFEMGDTFRVGEAKGKAALFRAATVHPATALAVPAARLLSLGLVDVAASSLVAGRERWAQFFGWKRGGLPPPPPEPSPLSARLARWRHRALDAFVAVYVLVFVSQAINENKAIPKPLKHDQPAVVRAMVLYPRLLQGWGMFAPNPVREDGKLAVDALTIDGRHIDPLQGGRPPDLNISDDRSSMLNQVHQDYGNRIRQDRHRVHLVPLARFLKRYHEYTGRPEDRIVWYAVYWVKDLNPDPGLREPTEHELFCIAGWRDKEHRPPAPKVCTIRSADKKKKKEEEEGDENEGEDDEPEAKPSKKAPR